MHSSDKEHTPVKETSFWCSVCDHFKVNSTNKDTGKFYVQFGHAFDEKSREYSGEYTGVMFSRCKACIEKESLKEAQHVR